MRTLSLAVLIVACSAAAMAQPTGPEVTSWMRNTTNATGYGGLPSNVQQVRYSAENVYVSCSCIPGYDIGPWQGNPNTPVNQNFVFKFTRSPQQNTGTPVETPLGHIGAWTNGVSIFNAKDARSYANAGVWHQNAILVEGRSFDACLGHPAPNGEYHHHLNPTCLYDDTDTTHHSPIIGYAFDGFPIYGAYGYSNADGRGGIGRIRSGYRLRSITERTTLPDGTVLDAARYGPAISTQYPLGYYTEDFEYVNGIGDLDEHNGRFCKTPEYPDGTYAYFVTLDAAGQAAYPYTLGPTYYGVVPPGNTGPQSGHNVPSEQVVVFGGVAGVDEASATATFPTLYPNPASTSVTIVTPATEDVWAMEIHDMLGRRVRTLDRITAGSTAPVQLEGLPEGMYLVHATSGTRKWSTVLAVTR